MRVLTLLIRKYGFILLLGMFSVLAVNSVEAQVTPTNGQPGDNVVNRENFLKNEAAAIANEAAELAAWRAQLSERTAAVGSILVDQAELDQAALEVDTRKVAQESTAIAISSAQQARAELASEIKQLEDRLQTLAATPKKSVDKSLVAQTRATLTEKQALHALEQRNIDQLERRRQLVKERTLLAEQWLTVLKDAYSRQEEQTRRVTLEELEKQVTAERGAWQEKATQYRAQVEQLRNQPAASQSTKDLAETQLTEAEESAFLSGVGLKIAQLQAQSQKTIADEVDNAADLRALGSSAAKLNQLKRQLDSIRVLITSKTSLLEQRREVILKRFDLEKEKGEAYRQIMSIFDGLIERFEQQTAALSRLGLDLEKQAQQIDAAYLERKKRGLTERHRLPLTLDQWEPLLIELHRLPTKVIQIAAKIVISLMTAMQQADLGRWSLLLFLLLVWSGGCLALGRLKRPALNTSEESFTRRALLISISLLRGNRFGLLLGGLLLITGWVLDIVPPGLAVIGSLFGIWLATRLIIGLSRWILNSPIGLADPQPGLFRLVVFFTILLSLFTLGLALGHLDFLSQPLRELFDRSFMLLLLPPAYLALRIHNLWYGMLREREGKTHWVRLAGLVGLAIPLAILTAALLGIFGYINLAWTLGGYLALTFAVIIGWMIARGLVKDLAKALEAKVTRKSERAAFWVKSLIEPLQYLIRLGLFLGAAWILYRLFVDDPATGLDLRAWLGHTLFTVGETSINSISLLSSVLLLLLVFYIGRWSREVTYGWIYANIRDLGVRNSLSVFTQYAVVVLGLLIALNLLGINLTSLAVFAGALGVGIGFGLQNIANNFISGIILLAERPVRTRDWVTIGDKEGKVAEIGMRSVTVTTWDNQDVIIPNSELISSSFINWTRTDSEVRTVLIIGVRYQDDPHEAQRVILEAVTMQPEVSLTPEPQVFLIDFAASSVNFRVQYFMDVQRFSRLEVQSKVLFAIWDALAEAGIGIPFPQQDIYIKELPLRK